MPSAIGIAVVFILATAMVEADQCLSGGECPSDREPQNVVSLLQSRVTKGDGDGEAPASMVSRRSDGDRDVPSSPRVAFLVRTYAPTTKMTERITKWVSSLQASPDVDVFISIDQTDETHANNVSSLLNMLRSTGFNLSHIHQYTVDNITQAYPALKGKLSLAYRYVDVAVDLFLQTLPHTTLTYDYLWVFEDDVGYTGDISKLLDKYSGSADDLINGAKGGTIHAGTINDFEQTDLCKKWVLPTQRHWAENHVTRMSSRLLGRLSHWLKAGAFDSSEFISPTVCKVEHMKSSTLEAMDLGACYGFADVVNGAACKGWIDATSSQAKWQAFQLEDAKLGKPRLYHPLKF